MEIPLNIIKSYPVSWNRYKIFRDFIQNFYDSVGYEKWNESLNYEYEDSSIVIWIDGITFSYEWLLHIGASTKTNSSNKNAGYFGEGFKIASLCAVRDYNYSIKMESADWFLSVKFVTHKIDDQYVEMMVYDVERSAQDLKKSRLTIKNIGQRDYEIFKTALLSFYYPENSIIGPLIWRNDDGAVHYRSSNPIPEELPYNTDFGRKGAIFCCYQMLGTCPFDLVVCIHNFRKDDRERSTLYRFEIIDIFEKLGSIINSEGAFYVLEKMRRYWNSVPKKNIDIYSWSDAIDRLIFKITLNEITTQKFKEKYSNILYLKKVKTYKDLNERHMALDWLKNRVKDKYILVKGYFRNLGYKSLEDFCRENGGFIEDGEIKNETENNCFIILEKLIDKIYDGFFILEDKPKFKVIINESAIYQGMATLTKKYDVQKNNYGIKVRNNVKEIYIKRGSLSKTSFYDALSTYIHELCHMFGSDASQSFSYALTEAMAILLDNFGEIEKSHKEWLDNFEKA